MIPGAEAPDYGAPEHGREASLWFDLAGGGRALCRVRGCARHVDARPSARAKHRSVHQAAGELPIPPGEGLPGCALCAAPMIVTDGQAPAVGCCRPGCRFAHPDAAVIGTPEYLRAAVQLLPAPPRPPRVRGGGRPAIWREEPTEGAAPTARATRGRLASRWRHYTGSWLERVHWTSAREVYGEVIGRGQQRPGLKCGAWYLYAQFPGVDGSELVDVYYYDGNVRLLPPREWADSALQAYADRRVVSMPKPSEYSVHRSKVAVA